MTLQELAVEYRESAKLVKKQMAILRKQKQTETDPLVLHEIEYKIKVLTPILTELNKTAERCAHYYGPTNGSPEHGNEERVGRKRRRTSRQRESEGFARETAYRAIENNRERIDRNTEKRCYSGSIRETDIQRDSDIKKRLSKYGLSQFQTGH